MLPSRVHGAGHSSRSGVCRKANVSGARVPPSAFPDSISKRPGDALGVHPTPLHLVWQELGAILTCRMMA